MKNIEGGKVERREKGITPRWALGIRVFKSSVFGQLRRKMMTDTKGANQGSNSWPAPD